MSKESQKAARRAHYERNRDAMLRQARIDQDVKRARNRALIIATKEATPCADCFQRFPHYVMDFDHVGDDKFKNVSQMLNYSTKTVLAEIAKCEIVCANCHRRRTYERGQWTDHVENAKPELPEGLF